MVTYRSWDSEWKHDTYASTEISEGHLRAKCARLTVLFNVYIHYHPKGELKDKDLETGKDIAYTLEDWKGEEGDFQKKFAAKLRKGFGDGRFWIVHDQSGTKDLWVDVAFNFSTNYQAFSPESRNRAQLCVLALKNPKPVRGTPYEYRDWCWIVDHAHTRRPPTVRYPAYDKMGDNPLDMALTLRSVVGGNESYSVPLNGGKTTKTFEQDTLLHEFGHYLQLEHRCADIARAAKKSPNGIEAYCWNRSEAEVGDLMAFGNNQRDAHGKKFASLVINRYRAAIPDATKILPVLAEKDRSSAPWIGNPKYPWAQPK
jgi:hypothetical protein